MSDAPPPDATAPPSPARTFLGAAFVGFGLFQLAIAMLGRGAGTEWLSGPGLLAIGAMNLLPPSRPALRLALGLVGIALVGAALARAYL